MSVPPEGCASCVWSDGVWCGYEDPPMHCLHALESAAHCGPKRAHYLERPLVLVTRRSWWRSLKHWRLPV